MTHRMIVKHFWTTSQTPRRTWKHFRATLIDSGWLKNHLCLGSTDKNIRSFTPHCRPEIRKYLLAPPLVTSDDTITFQLANWMTCKHLQSQLVNSYDMKIFPNIFAGDPNDRKTFMCNSSDSPYDQETFQGIFTGAPDDRENIFKHLCWYPRWPENITSSDSGLSWNISGHLYWRHGSSDNIYIISFVSSDDRETFQGISTGATEHRITFTPSPLSPRMIGKTFQVISASNPDEQKTFMGTSLDSQDYR